MTQKFETGDLVVISKNRGPRSVHYEGNPSAIILGSSQDLFGGKNNKDYSVFVEGHGPLAWFGEEHLTLVKKNKINLLRRWRDDYYNKI